MGKIVPKEIAQAIAAQRRMEPRTCVVCGKEVIGTSRRRYCSTPCTNRANYQRHAEERRAKQRERYQRQKAARTIDSAVD